MTRLAGAKLDRHVVDVGDWAWIDRSQRFALRWAAKENGETK